MSERSGVEIDYCPQCRGVWLDRGELDKIIERGNAQLAGAAEGRSDGRDRRDRDERRDRDRDRDRDKDQYQQQKPKKKKSSFLTDIFESLGE